MAAEPEPVEYVRVCDAYGTGYFYIPGTETCLSIGGYIRTEVRFGDHISGDSDVDFWTRGQVTFQAKNDTEYGTLTGVITLRYNVDDASDQEALLDEGYIDIAGFRVGMLYSWWDDDMSGETDTLASNETNHNSIRYQYENGAFAAGISVDELEEDYATKPGDGPNNYGVAGQVSYKAGAISAYLLAGYDTDTSEVAVRGIVYADIGPGTLGIAGVWASGANYYYEESEWTIAAEYALKINDKWKVTPASSTSKTSLSRLTATASPAAAPIPPVSPSTTRSSMICVRSSACNITMRTKATTTCSASCASSATSKIVSLQTSGRDLRAAPF